MVIFLNELQLFLNLECNTFRRGSTIPKETPVVWERFVLFKTIVK